MSELSRRKEDLEMDLKQIQASNDPNERENLLKQVREHNQEIATMERRISMLEESKRQLLEKQAKINQTLASSESTSSLNVGYVLTHFLLKLKRMQNLKS